MNEFLILFILKIKVSNIYEIKKFIDTNFAPFMQISSGAIIPTLKRLEDNDFIQSEKLISKGGLRKSFYSISQKGEDLFNSLLLFSSTSSPQIFRKELDVLFMIVNSKILTDEQNLLLKEKIYNILNVSISILKKTMSDNPLNLQYLQLELDYMNKKLDLLNFSQN